MGLVILERKRFAVSLIISIRRESNLGYDYGAQATENR